jgi:hypothetical protein
MRAGINSLAQAEAGPTVRFNANLFDGADHFAVCQKPDRKGGGYSDCPP